ncbi:MAG TPA: hypothetical protein VF904_04345 [Anaeromyxobacteraceae bacterium]
MAEKLQRSGAAVYAADGTYLGRQLQCDHSFMVIAKSWWRLDFFVVPLEEVAEVGAASVTLRCLADDVRPETADPWSPPPDPLGNANGVDLEPLRAGMAEFDGTHATASPEPRTSQPVTMSRPDPPLPSPEDIYGLDRERIARIDAQIDRYIAAELEDLLIAASCETPAGFQHVASYEAAFDLDATTHAHRPPAHRTRVVFPVPAGDRGTRFQENVAPESRISSFVGDEAARDPQALERALRRAGFSLVEAEAIASGGYEALAALRSASPPVAAAQQQAGSEPASAGGP